MTETITGFNDNNWQNLKKDLKKVVGNTAYNNWLKQLAFLSIDKDTISLSVPTKFLRDWIVNHYADKIKLHFKELNSNIDIIKIVVKPTGGRIVPGTARLVKDENKKWGNNLDIRNNQIDNSSNNFGVPLDPRFTFENFVVGKPNELAFAAAQRIAEADIVSFNPLFLYGGVGLGKTHLMHAIAWQKRKLNPKLKIMYLSAEKFMYKFIKALRLKNTVAFKDQFRSVNLLMIDDVQFIIGKESTQEEFFHTFNALADQNRQMVISADKSPSDLEGLEERLRSRLGWGLVADIHPTTYELRLSIIEAKIEKYNIGLPKDVMEFLAHKITASVRELEGALTRLAAHVTLVGRTVDLAIAEDLLQDLLRASDRRATIDQIQKKVAEHFNVKMSDMHSARRSRTIARPRQVAMFLAKNLTTRSLPEIGRKFGGRDHTTVIHAIKKIKELVKNDSSLSEDIEILTRNLQS